MHNHPHRETLAWYGCLHQSVSLEEEKWTNQASMSISVEQRYSDIHSKALYVYIYYDRTLNFGYC
jgi:hypothetical protein